MKYIQMTGILFACLMFPLIYMVVFLVWFPVGLLSTLVTFFKKLYKMYKAVDNYEVV